MIRKKTGRGRRISSEVRQLIISQAIHDSKTMPRRALAVRLQDLIEKMGEVSPTEDTLARMISEARNKQPSELERPWSIGACSYYNIPHDMIPVLIKIQKLKAEYGDDEDVSRVLTVREARWMARLYRVAEPLISELSDGLLWLDFIASSYVKRERVSEQMNEQYPNTADLDRLYFHSEDFLNHDVLISWWDALLPDHKEAIIDAVEKERAMTLQDIERHEKRPLSPEETKMIDDCFDSIEKGGLVALREFINQSQIAQEHGMLHLMTAILYETARSGGIK
ncbi:MAG: hypothetical protein Q8O55_03615 [Dehalococcoidales bacterium]|nr:hypothetical protein [Dehalococcoidales bacterium]